MRCADLQKSLLVVVILSLLSGCATSPFGGPRTETVLPLNFAWAEGGKVEYVTTDASDAGIAEMAGANYVPSLGDVIPRTPGPAPVARVYMFPEAEQIGIFQVAPRPAGPANSDPHYSPLWRVVMVNWLKPDRVRELKSEGELLDALDDGEVAFDVTRIVVNCPVTRSADGQFLRGVR